MMFTQIGDHTLRAQKFLLVGCRRKKEHAPIHHLQIAEKTTVNLDQTSLLGNATISNGKVKRPSQGKLEFANSCWRTSKN